MPRCCVDVIVHEIKVKGQWHSFRAEICDQDPAPGLSFLTKVGFLSYLSTHAARWYANPDTMGSHQMLCLGST